MIKHSLFNKIDGRSIELLVSVSGDTITAALFYFQQGALPEKLFETSTPIKISDKENFFNRAALGQALESVTESIVTGAKTIYEIKDLFRDHQKIHRVEIMLTAPWVHYKAREGRVVLEKPERIDEAKVSMLLAENESNDHIMIDRTIHDMKLNGYQVSPERYQRHAAKTIEIGYVDALMPFAHYNMIIRSFEKNLGIEEDQISWISGLSVLHHNSFLNYEHPFPDYRMLLVNAYGIEEFIISDGNIKTHSHASYGKSSLMRELVDQKMVHSFDEARTLSNSYLEGHLSENENKKIESIISLMLKNMRLASKKPTFVLAERADMAFIKKTAPHANFIHLNEEVEVSGEAINSKTLAAFFQFLNG